MISTQTTTVLAGFLDNFLNEYKRQLRLQDEDRIGDTLDLQDIRLDMLLSLIKEESRDRVLDEFTAFNQRHYKQHRDAKAFLNCFISNLSTAPETTKFEFHHYDVLLGVPILVISDSMLDLLYDNSVGGLHMEQVGIVIQEGNQADYFLTHEMLHSFVEYLKSKGTFKETRSGLFGVRTMYDTVVSLLRNETIAYLGANPGYLGKMTLERACHALTQQSPEQLNKINPELVRIVEMIQKLDKSKRLSNTQVARAALLNPGMNDFCQAIIDAIDASNH
jgi:hypothetical protein